MKAYVSAQTTRFPFSTQSKNLNRKEGLGERIYRKWQFKYRFLDKNCISVKVSTLLLIYVIQYVGRKVII